VVCWSVGQSLIMMNPAKTGEVHLDQFSHFCIAHDRATLYLTMGCSPSSKLLIHGGSGAPSNTIFLGPIRAHNPNGNLIVSAIFAQPNAECPCILQWSSLPPLKIVASCGGCGPPSNTWFPGPPKSSTQMAFGSLEPFL